MTVSQLSLLGVGGIVPFADPPIPASPLARWRNSAGTSTTTNATSLNSWTDVIGGNAATQGGTTAQMPTYLTGQIPSAQPGYDMGISFDGTDDFLSNTPLATSIAYSLFVTMKRGTGGILTSGAAGHYLLYDAGTTFHSYSGGSVSASSPHGMTPGNWYTVGMRISSGGAIDWSINTTATASLGSGTLGSGTFSPSTIGVLFISPSYFNWFNGEIAEMLFYNRQLTTAEFAQAMTAHRQLYGIF